MTTKETLLDQQAKLQAEMDKLKSQIEAIASF